MVRAVTDDDTGVQVLYEPAPAELGGSDEIIDILAVHGIGAHPDDTWCKNVGTKENPRWVNWLSDATMLPAVVAHARIMRFGYKSQWFGADAIKQNTSVVAQQLLPSLRRRRKEFPFRPLIIIAHCFGGLVVLKALVKAYHDTKQWHGIFQSTTGLVFFGTPFRGAEGMSQSEMLQAALSEYEQEEVHTEVLTILDPGNELLQDLVDEFGTTRSLPNKAQVACFFELQPSNVGAIVGKQRRTRFAVSQSSGCLDVSDATEKYPLQRCHFSMNKFGKPSESDFEIVSEVVEKMARAAPGLLLARSQYQGKHLVPFSLKALPAVSRFVERKNEMQAMEEYFLSRNQDIVHSVTAQKTFLLHGLGGMGKTQLAVAFARKHHDKFSAVLWLDGSSVDQLKQSFVAVASKLPQDQFTADVKECCQAEKIDADIIVKGVLAWLSLPSNKHWLLIIDNVDREWTTRENDPLAYDAKEYFPHGDHGSILVTSRLAGAARLFEAELLVDRVDHAQARSMLESNACRELEDAQTIIDKLDRLPLALTQAGAYLREANIGASSYIKHYDTTWKDLMEKQGRYPLQEYGDRSILTTWMISYKQVVSGSEGAANLLKLWAFLDRKDLWYGLFVSTYAPQINLEVPRWLAVLAESELEFYSAIGLLRRYSLVDVDGQQTESHKIHAVLHEWCHYLSEDDEQESMLLLASRVVAQAVPAPSKTAYRELQRRLLPHGMHVYAKLKLSQRRHDWTLLDKDGSLASIAHNLGHLFAAQGKLAESEVMYQQALAGYDKTLGPKHTSTLGTVHNLGHLFQTQNNLAKAEQMYKRALSGYEEVVGPKHTSALRTVNNLGNLYLEQGKLAEAETMYERALLGYEETLGPAHTYTLHTVNNLGNLYADQSKIAMAETMYARAFAGYEDTLGPDHEFTLDTVANLGDLHFARDKFTEAETMYDRALVGYEKTLWPKHTSTIRTVNSLGNLYRNQDKLTEAKTMYDRALAGYEEVLGPMHTHTLDVVSNLGNLFSRLGKRAEAEAMYARALAGKEKALGAEHTSTLDTVNNLGTLYCAQGKLAKAEAMYARALTGYEKALGAEHADTLRTVNNVGELYSDQGKLYSDQGKLAHAEMMLDRALAGREKVLGTGHTSTLNTVNNLGNLYTNQGKLAEAEQMYDRALAGYKETLGPAHTSTLRVLNNLGTLYCNQGKLAEAETMYVRVLSGYGKVLGSTHTSTLDVVWNLGNLYYDQRKLEEAEQMYERALAGYERGLGPNDLSIFRTVNSLGNLYSKQGKLAEAEQMYDRALAGYEEALGPIHTSTLDTVNSLGNLYTVQGKPAEAELKYKRALAGYEETLGSAHKSTLRPLNSLGNLYYAQGKLAEAETMYNRALIICTETPGHGHQDTLCAVRNFSLLCRKRHRLDIHSVNKDRIWSSIFGAKKHISPKYIIVVTRLWIEQNRARSYVMKHVGHMLLSMGRYQDAIITFEQQIISDKEVASHDDVVCDGCDNSILLPGIRYVCVSCDDVDLCATCHQDYELDGRLDRELTSCQNHIFVAVPREIWSTLPSGAVSVDGSTVEDWMNKLLLSLTKSNDDCVMTEHIDKARVQG